MGGTRSGKSSFAEGLVEKLGANIAYLATAQSLDQEMEDRITLHRKRRSDNWTTYEEPIAVANMVNKIKSKHDIILLDCLTLLVSNLLLKDLDFAKLNTEIIQAKEYLILQELEQIIENIATSDCKLVVVSSEVGLGLVPSDVLSRAYRDIIGRCNQLLAEHSNNVYLVWAGLPIQLKPTLERIL